MSILGIFEVVSLGIHSPDYFQGFGSGSYTNSCVGIGDTEEAALADCMEMIASSGINNFEERIRDEHGETDDVSICVSCEKSSPDDDPAFGDNCANCDIPYFHVGIRWNSRDEDRLRRIKAIRGVEPLRYASYEHHPSDTAIYTWCTVQKADGRCSYGDFESTDWPVNAEEYSKTLSNDIEETGEVYFYVPYASGSDYSGSTVEKANAKCIEEDFGENEWVHPVYGGHGTYAVAIGLTGLLGCEDDTFDDLCEILEGLVDYPLINDEAHSLLEMELADEAWELWASQDFESALEKAFPDYTFDWPDDLRGFFEEKREAANIYWESEVGASMYIRLDDIVESIIFDDIDQWTLRYEVTWNDCGKNTRSYYSEDEVERKVDALREGGLVVYGREPGYVEIGASYQIIEPDHLKIEAQQIAERRGHKLGPWVDIDDNHSRAVCTVCGKDVDIIRKPKPNEINIGGPAVALGCEK